VSVFVFVRVCVCVGVCVYITYIYIGAKKGRPAHARMHALLQTSVPIAKQGELNMVRLQ
jgi:hypothetical protein